MIKPVTSGDTPFRINLEQQKKRAKELLKAFRSVDNHEAINRFKKSHPGFMNGQAQASAAIKLSDAQLVIARELGLASWPQLKAHIDAMSQASAAITSNQDAPDARYSTLHIRCGSDLESVLPEAGFTGDFLEYSEVYGQGPVIHNNHFSDIRNDFLCQAYGSYLDTNIEALRGRFDKSHQQLKQAADNYERVVLWFEHDSFDQLILARILAYFETHTMPRRLELASVNHFPGSMRFTGLGQLPEEALRLIWDQRKPITKDQLKLSHTIWLALGQESPEALFEITQATEIKHLADMKSALIRHLQELPSTFNGLGLTQQLSLQMLSENSMTAGQMFRRLMLELEPLPWLGDVMYWFILDSMMEVSEAVLTVRESEIDEPWQKREFSITDVGRELLQGNIDWLSFNPPERWLGGIKINSSDICWRWDMENGNVIRQD